MRAVRGMAMGGGWRQVKNGVWRKRWVVPPPHRAFLPAPYATAGRNGEGKSTGRPLGTLTRSTGTSNKNEALAFAARMGFDTWAANILGYARVAFERFEKGAETDWAALATFNERDALLSDREIDQAEAAYHERREHPKDDPFTAAVKAATDAALRAAGIDPRPKSTKRVKALDIWESWQQSNGTTDSKSDYKGKMAPLSSGCGPPIRPWCSAPTSTPPKLPAIISKNTSLRWRTPPTKTRQSTTTRPA
jgi:hypothetical protein